MAGRALGYLAAAICVGALAVGCGTTKDRSAEIATKIGATSCTQTRYEIISKIDQSKTRIYDCQLDGGVKCVTESNGIVNDSTAVARILFASELAGGKPDCVR